MEYSEFSRKGIETVRKLSAELVAELAPEEARFFDDFFSEYIKGMAERSEGEPLAADEGFGFSATDVQSLLTPTVISAVIVGISKIVELLAAKRQSQRQQREDISLDDINFHRIEQELFTVLRSWRVGRARAQRIAKEFVARVAHDPTVALKVAK